MNFIRYADDFVVTTPIKRHIKVQGEANPYDPAYETYFEDREGSHMLGTFRGTETLRFLWTEQRGLCAVCNVKITRITGWRPSPLRPSCEGWFEERGQPRSTSSRVPRQSSPSAPFRIEAASPSKRRSQGLSRMSTKVSRPVLRGPGGRKAAWLLGSEYTNVRKRR